MKKFFIIWISQAFSIFGSAVVGFALAWYLTKETGSATVLAVSLMLNFIPAVVLGPFIGPLIDRWKRKYIIMFADAFTALLTVGLVILFLTDAIQVWHIYVAMAGRAVGNAFQGPAIGASIPMIVEEKHLTRANGLNMTLNGLINIVGPPAGAFLMEVLPMQGVLSVDIITAVIAIGCIIPLAIPQPPRTTLSAKLDIIGDMKQGFRYIASWRGLLILVIFFAVLNFFSAPLIALMPLYVTQHLHGEVWLYGWLVTAMGIGTITGGLLIGIWGGSKRKIVTMFVGIGIECIAIIVMGAINSSLSYVALAMMLVIGGGMAISNAPIGAILQSTVARDAQGRIFALLGTISGAMMPLGLIFTGPLADAIGVRSIFFIIGIILITVTAAATFFRSLVHMEDHKPEEQRINGAVPESPGGK
jgi:MFS transporter, DHA3 family, macrolide efflux protein